jgi:transcription elongation factor Elf1
MSCLGCNNITDKPVTLHTGAVVCNTCEAWRHECEAKAIAALPDLAQRRAWLEAVEKKRGKAATDNLRDTLRSLWAIRK